jgi:hypothetical protein
MNLGEYLFAAGVPAHRAVRYRRAWDLCVTAPYTSVGSMVRHGAVGPRWLFPARLVFVMALLLVHRAIYLWSYVVVAAIHGCEMLSRRMSRG